MSGLLVRTFLLVSVSFLAPLSLSGRLRSVAGFFSGGGSFWKVQLDVRVLVVILISQRGLELEHFPKALVMLFLGSLLEVLYLWVSG